MKISEHREKELHIYEETNKMLHLEQRFVWCWQLGSSENRSELSWEFWNVVLVKDGEDPLEWAFEK